jgi:hypothetical protein
MPNNLWRPLDKEPMLKEMSNKVTMPPDEEPTLPASLKKVPLPPDEELTRLMWMDKNAKKVLFRIVYTHDDHSGGNK